MGDRERLKSIILRLYAINFASEEERSHLSLEISNLSPEPEWSDYINYSK